MARRAAENTSTSSNAYPLAEVVWSVVYQNAKVTGKCGLQTGHETPRYLQTSSIDLAALRNCSPRAVITMHASCFYILLERSSHHLSHWQHHIDSERISSSTARKANSSEFAFISGEVNDALRPAEQSEMQELIRNW
jgi:hypothetical protein